ncbi:MAG TPA: DnaJ domain-containing protein [Candidatus Limnocylindrales bacterium]|nr:DnaJ domain-containing protein [Candidatus Limnocylindrales bacterium]
MTPERDAYAVLQVDPRAELDVIRAAFRALARRYHPDGTAPDIARMAELNRAYAHVKTHELRTQYDQLGRQPVAMGPGRDGTPAAPYDPWRRQPAQRPGSEGDVIDFGRYAGWRVADLARHDPDYLRWLSRHSGGIRFRQAIARVLPGDDGVGRRGSVVG